MAQINFLGSVKEDEEISHQSFTGMLEVSLKYSYFLSEY